MQQISSNVHAVRFVYLTLCDLLASAVTTMVMAESSEASMTSKLKTSCTNLFSGSFKEIVSSIVTLFRAEQDWGHICCPIIGCVGLSNIGRQLYHGVCVPTIWMAFNLMLPWQWDKHVQDDVKQVSTCNIASWMHGLLIHVLWQPLPKTPIENSAKCQHITKLVEI